LAMGKSTEDHTPVIEYYHREVKKLMKGFLTYFGVANEIRRMSVGFLFHLSDRPERQLSLTQGRRAISESAPIMRTVLTSTNYQHARNVTKKSLPKFLPGITFQNLAHATNVSDGILIQTTHFNQVVLSQRTTLWDQMK
jgi:hypothetical protein